MNWLNRAEAKFGHLAIPGLPRVIVGFNLLVFILFKFDPQFVTWLTLDPSLIRQGQVWRFLTFAFIPGFGPQPFEWVGLVLYLLAVLYIGGGLEQAMGAFRLNLYYLFGLIGIGAAAMLFGPRYAAVSLNATMFYAFARFYPESVIYIMFILPVKVKWMAWISGAMLILLFISGENQLRASVIVGLLNYFLFFGGDLVRDARHRGQVSARRQKFQADLRRPDEETLHRCETCGRTEVTDPYLDFRVTREGKEYCVEHLPAVSTTGGSGEPDEKA